MEPRKTPVQARSTFTVEAIFEATVQVLLNVGPQRLTTTRIAERAGISVGTLYQYFPNKQSLLYAVLQRHLERVTATVEQASFEHRYQPLEVQVAALVSVYVSAKLANIDEARALYLISGDAKAQPLVDSMSARFNAALAAVLQTTSNARFADIERAVFFWRHAMSGPICALLEGWSPSLPSDVIISELTSMTSAYLQSLGQTHTPQISTLQGVM
jgi:AcrR family transcriptional regulator